MPNLTVCSVQSGNVLQNCSLNWMSTRQIGFL